MVSFSFHSYPDVSSLQCLYKIPWKNAQTSGTIYPLPLVPPKIDMPAAFIYTHTPASYIYSPSPFRHRPSFTLSPPHPTTSAMFIAFQSRAPCTSRHPNNLFALGHPSPQAHGYVIPFIHDGSLPGSGEAQPTGTTLDGVVLDRSQKDTWEKYGRQISSHVHAVQYIHPNIYVNRLVTASPSFTPTIPGRYFVAKSRRIAKAGRMSSESRLAHSRFRVQGIVSFLSSTTSTAFSLFKEAMQISEKPNQFQDTTSGHDRRSRTWTTRATACSGTTSFRRMRTPGFNKQRLA
ncbi:hypothetical protein OF83DRAFT_258856 [Amylostereum chailletii]|nr:hypothetical protein OF83DRAFT_258856 [Amylostereum chailletii]